MTRNETESMCSPALDTCGTKRTVTLPVSIRAAKFIGVFAMVLVCSLSACTSDDSVSVLQADSSKLFWALQANAKAVTVGLGGTQQLHTATLYASGDTMPDAPRPTFQSLEPSKVTVDSNGVITGVALTSGVDVISSLTINGLTHADTTVVAVTTTTASLGSLKLTGSGGFPVDTILQINGYGFIDYAATDSLGNPLSGLAVSVRALDPNIIDAETTFLQGLVLGKTKIILSTLSYGRMLADTVEFRVLYANTATVYTSGESITGPMFFSPSTVVVATGGTVTWSNYFYGQLPASVIFDNGGEHITGGNIPSMGYFESASRTFPVAGTYTYTNTLNGGTGTVIVRDQPSL